MNHGIDKGVNKIMLALDKLKIDKTDEIKEIIDEAYQLGKDDGYDEGYNEGMDDADNSDEIDDAYEEGKDNGRNEFLNELINSLGYLTIRNIQEKSGYQICYGNDVNFDELIKAIRYLNE